MATAWRCAPCQQMRRIQITQWSDVLGMQFTTRENRVYQMRVASLKRVGLCWLGRSAADRVAASTRADASQAVSASCHCNQNFCPPSGSDAYLQIRRAPRTAATWVDVMGCQVHNLIICIIYSATITYSQILARSANECPSINSIVAISLQVANEVTSILLHSGHKSNFVFGYRSVPMRIPVVLRNPFDALFCWDSCEQLNCHVGVADGLWTCFSKICASIVS